MENAPPSPEVDIEVDYLLGRARSFILHLLGMIETVILRLEGAPMSAALMSGLIRRCVLPAEAALRRAVLIIAQTLPPLAPPRGAAPRASGLPPRVVVGKGQPPARAPVFRMSEPQPRQEAAAGYLPEHLMPRITLLVDSALQARSAPARPAPLPRDPAETFQRRLAALHAAYDNPVAVARRWLRRHAARPAIAARVLAPVKIPGAYRRLGEENLLLLRELTESARRTLTADTS